VSKPTSDSSPVLSHWHYRVEDFNTSAVEFYAAIRRELEAIKVPVSFGTVEWSEGTILSAKRLYLRIESHRLTFDICAAPYGTSFFFSWWFARKPVSLAVGCLGILALPILWGLCVWAAGIVNGTILAIVLSGIGLFSLGHVIREGASDAAEIISDIPFIGPILARFIRPITYYSIDTRIMFEETVHDVVIRVVDGLLVAKGAKALTPDQRKLTFENTFK
jgi:hypothetical protein